MKRRSLLASVPFLLSGCLGFGSSNGSTPTPPRQSPPPPETDPPPTTATGTRTRAATPTSTPSGQRDFQPDGPVIDVGETISAGSFEFQATDWVLKRDIRYLDARTETIEYVAPNGSNTRWFQVSGRVTNTGESLVPVPSLDDFRVRHRGGRAVPIYRIEAVGGWGYLRESGLDGSIRRPGLDRDTTYLTLGETVAFHVLFVVNVGPALYLEWDTSARPESVVVRVAVEG